MSAKRPKFSVVVPMCQTAAYLPELLESFSAQKAGSYETEYIFIDDGSDDDVAVIAEEWINRADVTGEVIRQENFGVSAARNQGISRATGEWITFPDSDDVVSDEYFRVAADAANSVQSPALLSANVWHFQDGVGATTDTHPLRAKFARGNGPTDLNKNANFIQSQAASAFFRLDLIKTHNIRFIEGLSVAEDAVFTASYLLVTQQPRIVPLPEARYFYRKRAAASSAVDNYRTNPDYFYGRFERGYLPLLGTATQQGGVPLWLQNTVLYDVSWFLAREQQVKFKATYMEAEEKQRVLRLLREVLQYVDEATILKYKITALSVEVRALLLTLAGKKLPHSGMCRIARDLPGVLEVNYLFQGERPSERVTSRGKTVELKAAKTRKLDYFGQEQLHERILRFPMSADLTLFLDDVPQHFRRGRYFFGTTQISATTPKPRNRRRGGTPHWKRMLFSAAVQVCDFGRIPVSRPSISSEIEKRRIRRERERIWNSAATPRYRKKYGNAWLLMDKLSQGRDSAEYLYGYLRQKRRDINAWFVLDDQSPDWPRLERENVRLIAYGSREHKIALQLADVVASTHLDVEIIRPIPGAEYRDKWRPWRFIYLQHGVLQHNLAHWFNSKNIDLVTTASPDEHESIIGTDTAYKLTEDSVVLTGFPRHDVVRARAEKTPYTQRNLILIAPTWRNSMHLPRTVSGKVRELRSPFSQTAYGQNWMGFLQSAKLQELAEKHDAKIAFLPHPNLRPHLDHVVFPEHVEILTANPDVHELVATARVVVTDYSSVSFEAALAGARLIYFQFDQSAFLHGGHTYIPGYWNYNVHGFGPITTGVEEAASAVETAFQARDDDWPDIYQQRIAKSLPRADGNAAERIVATVEKKFFATSSSKK